MPLWRNLAVAFLITIGTNAPTAAQDYPTRPVRIVVPFAPGGPSDTFARQIGEQLSKSFRHPFIVENLAGGSSIVGTEAVARSAPDGYSLLLISNTHATNEVLIARKSYQLMRDFVPVAPVNTTDLVMLVPPSLPVGNLKEFIELAKSRPKKLNYASSGPGSPFHMAGELLKSMSGTDIVHIPYRSTPGAQLDLVAGELHLMFDLIPAAMERIRSGQVRALGTTGKARSPLLPEVPTISEAGLPGFETVFWMGVAAPAGTPRTIIDWLNAEIADAVLDPALRELWAKQGTTPLVMTPPEFEAYLYRDIERWTDVIRRSGLKLD